MSEYRFKIDNYTPETIPMEVLADYLADLAVLLGETKSVHFVRVESGSVVPVIKVEETAAPKVRERMRAVRARVAPVEALRAFQSINARLQSHNAVGQIYEGDAEIIAFPGRNQPVEPKYGAIARTGTLDGEIIRIGGRNRNKVPIGLEVEDDIINHVYARKGVAKELSVHLYEPVRLYGAGKWSRDDIGVWKMDEFNVSHFERLKGDGLSSALMSLRSVVGGGWIGNAIDDLRADQEEDGEE